MKIYHKNCNHDFLEIETPKDLYEIKDSHAFFKNYFINYFEKEEEKAIKRGGFGSIEEMEELYEEDSLYEMTKLVDEVEMFEKIDHDDSLRIETEERFISSIDEIETIDDLYNLDFDGLLEEVIDEAIEEADGFSLYLKGNYIDVVIEMHRSGFIGCSKMYELLKEKRNYLGIEIVVSFNYNDMGLTWEML